MTVGRGEPPATPEPAPPVTATTVEAAHAEQMAHAEQLPEPERYGPLLVKRTHKADGRALILYERVAHDGG